MWSKLKNRRMMMSLLAIGVSAGAGAIVMSNRRRGNHMNQNKWLSQLQPLMKMFPMLRMK